MEPERRSRVVASARQIFEAVASGEGDGGVLGRMRAPADGATGWAGAAAGRTAMQPHGFTGGWHADETHCGHPCRLVASGAWSILPEPCY